MIAFAHGYRGSPLTSDYLAAMSVFASYGYIVVAPFYGDPRFTDLTVDNLGDAVALLANLSDFTALQALRALSTSAEIDLMLSDPQWSDHIDATQIGGFGASMGGETLLLLGGAGLTTSLDLAQTQVTVDTRLKAAVGYVPFFGELFLPAFGRDQSGLDSVTLPYLAISGTADTLAPIIMTRTRHQPARRDARTRVAGRCDTWFRCCVDQRHLHLGANVSRRGGSGESGRAPEVVDDGECGWWRRRSRGDSL